MTQEQIQRRSLQRDWNKLKRRAARSPHGQKLQREKELRSFVKAQLLAEVA